MDKTQKAREMDMAFPIAVRPWTYEHDPENARTIIWVDEPRPRTMVTFGGALTEADAKHIVDLHNQAIAPAKSTACDPAEDVVICPDCGAHLQRVFPFKGGAWGCVCQQCKGLFNVYFDRLTEAPIHIEPDPEVQRD